MLPPYLKEPPTKIITVELNYTDHADALHIAYPQKPLLLYKPVETIIGNDDSIVIPRNCFSVDYQAALAVIIHSKLYKKPIEEVMKHIEGYTCANDITLREVPAIRHQFSMIQSYPTLTPLGPQVVKEIDPNAVAIYCYVNGERRQKSTTKNFIFSVEKLLYFISQETVLYPGDIIITGTPYGIGPLIEGDTVEVQIEGIGTLRNAVVKQEHQHR